MKRLFASLMTFLCTTYALNAQTTWFVAPGAPTTGSGSSWANPIELQTAINNGSAGDSIFVAQGTYQPGAGTSYYMKEGEMVYGGFAGTETSLSQRNLTSGYTSILKGNNAKVVYNYYNGLTAAAVLDGFTITGGNATYGGGMLNNNASPTISNCIFSNNYGGGLYNAYSSATVVKCVFANNSGPLATDGGGLTNASSPGVSVINCIFWGNTGQFGGAIYIDDLGPTSCKIINCTFWGNATVSNTLGNYGVIYCQARSSPIIENCIIWGNSSAIKTSSSAPPPVIANNIIQGGYPGNMNSDPLFVNPGNAPGPDNIWGTADDGLIPQAGSPAANAGIADTTGLGLPATDMAGAARIQGGRIDLGAYESSFSCSTAGTLYVDSSIAASGDGSTWATAFKTLGEALLAGTQCSVVTQILVAKGTYQCNAGSPFGMLPHVQMYGGFPSGGGSFSQRNMTTNTSTLTGNGSGVMYNVGLDPDALLDGFTISGGSAVSGAGMFNSYASININNCIFSGNAAKTNSGSGGGMYNVNCAPTISNCLFSGNSTAGTSSTGGGAMLNTNASPQINNTVFYNNSASYGGAIFNLGSAAPVITNSVFAANNSTNDAAAIGNYGSSLKLTNTTFSNNTAGGGGGAIDNYGASLSVINSIFWGNASTDANKDLWLETGTTSVTYSFTQISQPGTGNILGSASPFSNDANPAGPDGIFGTTDDGLTLAAGSPCINTGTPDISTLGLPGTDIAGNLRVIGAAIDMGAYEYNSTVLPIKLISFNGYLQNGTASLHWNTALESNFNHFEVEKSTDSSSFHTRGTVPAKGSNSSYNFDTPQEEASAFYRLKIVDNDGSATYSRILRLSQNISGATLIFPNPATNQVNIRIDQTGIASIFAADGKLVKMLTILPGINSVDISDLSAGLYYIFINGTSTKLFKK